MQTQLQTKAARVHSVGTPAPSAASTFTPDQLAKAKVPFGLARWYHCTGAKLVKRTLLDEARLDQVKTAVAFAA